MELAQDASPASAASLIAHWLIRTKRFVAAAVPEAQPLVEACDLVLTRSDGMSFNTVGLIDASEHPERRLALTKDQLIEVANGCLRYTGKMNGHKLPASVMIYEIRAHVTAEDVARAAACKKAGFSKTHVSLSMVDLARNQVFPKSLIPVSLWTWRRAIERLLRGPRTLPEAPVADAAPAPVARAPALTCALLAVLALVFLLELLFPVGASSDRFSPSVMTLVAFGGSTRDLVLRGDWYRLLMPMFLHGGVLHLLFNGVALFMAGMVLESVVGRVWLLALFFLGGVGGSALSVLLNPPSVVSVGASGAIMGLLAAGVVLAQRYPPGIQRVQAQSLLLRILVPSLLPLATVTSGAHIDYGAHLGGAIVGGLAGFALYRAWPRGSALPPWSRAAQAIGALSVVAVLAGAYQVKGAYAEMGHELELIPDELLKNLPAPEQLTRTYPHDPRSHYLLGVEKMKAGDFPGAEADLRAALAEKRNLEMFFADGRVEGAARATLALVLVSQDRAAEAKAIAQPACSSKEPYVHDQLLDLKLCP